MSVDGLYALPPEEFVAARNALARTLPKPEAAEVRKLRRPSVVAWAINQAVRRSPALVAALLDAGEALRAAQEAAVTGGGGGAALREATAARRDAVRRLAAEVGVRPEYAGAVAATLEAATVDSSVAEALRAGRLEREVEPGGFGFGDIPDGWTPPAHPVAAGPSAIIGRDHRADTPRKRPSAPDDHEGAGAAAERLAAAEREAAGLVAAAEAAEAELARLRAEVATASTAARNARTRARKAELAVERIRHEIWDRSRHRPAR